MSMFLGPIHCWLYDKIGNQEALTKQIADFAVKAGFINDRTLYSKTLPPLEEVIDEENIHGWLQGCISDAENRYARLVTLILSRNEKQIETLESIAFAFGAEHAVPTGSNAQTAYKAFDDFFVNGMPCDRVNVLTRSDSDIVSWKQTQDIHAPYWIENDCNTKPYYDLRKRIMDGMLAGTGLSLSSDDDGLYTISKQ